MLSRVYAPAAGETVAVGDRAQGAPSSVPFADHLASQLGAGGIRLSAHAQARLRQSGVGLDAAAADRLKSAVERAEQKGSKDSVVLLDDLAFVVSVENKTIITAMESNRAKENVFTNIDSVVIG